MPALSVLLPVRDGGPWLASSLASLARQTFADFEIVAVDDGSTDGSAERLAAAARREPRLRVMRSPGRGLPAALAFALSRARGALIARHDADDLSHRERFARQVAHLGAHPEVGVVGARLRAFPDAATGAGMRRWVRWHNALLTHEAMAREVLIDSPLAHGTALIRRAALERAGGWIERGWPEDVDLWLRLLAGGVRFAKLPRVLYGWRQHPQSATRRDPRYAPARFAALRLAALRAGFLRGRSDATVIGVGLTLEGWTRRLRAAGVRVRAVPRGRPDGRAPVPDPPLVLAFGTAPARDRWRRHLERTGLRESRDFIFVA